VRWSIKKLEGKWQVRNVILVAELMKICKKKAYKSK